jgi:hypothetical protein
VDRVFRVRGAKPSLANTPKPDRHERRAREGLRETVTLVAAAAGTLLLLTVAVVVSGRRKG